MNGRIIATVLLGGLAALVVVFEPLGRLVAGLLASGADSRFAIDLLLVPIGAAVIVALRTLVGVEGFGLFAPLILAYSFSRIGTLRGLLTFGCLLLVLTPARILLERVLILSVARTGILISACAVGLLLLTALALGEGVVTHSRDLGMPVVIMAGLVDRFVTAQMDQSTGEATKLSLYTLLSATLVAALFSWELLRHHLASTPDLALLGFPVCLLAGRYTGLRITEYLRFAPVGRGA